jgi:hypothetical protein
VDGGAQPSKAGADHDDVLGPALVRGREPLGSLFQKMELLSEAVGQNFRVFLFHDLAEALVKHDTKRTDGDAEDQVGGARHGKKCTRAQNKNGPSGVNSGGAAVPFAA